MLSPLRMILMVVTPTLCVLGCASSSKPEVRPTLRPSPPAHDGGASQGAPSTTPTSDPAAFGPHVHVSQAGITLDGTRIETKVQAASSPQTDHIALLESLQESLTRERQSAGSSTEDSRAEAHYALTVEPDLPFGVVKRTIRACRRAGYAFVRLSCGETTFEFFVDEWFRPEAEPLVELHELGIRIDSSAVTASVFRVAPSLINSGMFQRTLRIERALPRVTSYIALSEFALAINDLDPPVCSDPGAACFDRLAFDADDTIPFGEVMSILAAMDSGLRPAIALPWTTRVPVRLLSLRVGTFHPGGKLPPEQVSSVIYQNFARIGECYREARRRDPKLKGDVRVQFKIDLEGKVVEAVEAPEPSADAMTQAQSGSPFPTIHDPKMVSCVLAEFAKIQFARSEREGWIFTIPLRFVP